MHREFSPGFDHLFHFLWREAATDRPTIRPKPLLPPLHIKVLAIERLSLAPGNPAAAERRLHEVAQALPGLLRSAHCGPVTAVSVVLGNQIDFPTGIDELEPPNQFRIGDVLSFRDIGQDVEVLCEVPDYVKLSLPFF